MLDFILNVIVSTLAIYGFIEIIKKIYSIICCTHFRADGIYIIVAAKNQEDKIEAFLRTTMFRFIYGKEEMIKQILVADLGSKDETAKIIQNLGKDYEYIKPVEWSECKEIIDNIKEV
jgi:hypothetical protein